MSFIPCEIDTVQINDIHKLLKYGSRCKVDYDIYRIVTPSAVVVADVRVRLPFTRSMMMAS